MTSVVDITDSAGGGSGYNNFDHRVIVWPVYLDKKKTVAEGRKIPIEWCVEYPQMGELRDVLDHLGFEHAYEESKCYPRDLTQYGRFRVLLKDPMTGAPKVEGITTRRQLLKAMGELIPKLKSRADGKVKGPETPGIPLPGYPYTLLPIPQGPPPAAIAASASAGASGGSSKKKGKAPK